ncbi:MULTISPECIES: FmdB family zinc ribbon protein [Limnobaculum]|uniref:Zinc ribbon domain-containing protein n=2 Tax=Limnobaculum TaxID=2172100 RepID=A0A2Y9TUX5_9GAMM|nr:MULTISPECIES: zinc ribbon domain-containing protein [Limnobaculum]AWH87485.1 zinc ribbon domain-containing protein [Limnobaculum parvum]QBH96530.1 zinc ribbon domain-containing protein [Limnobaculum zhutongyuii]TQS90439.1 zinc ribbon domain-containing protein [Limnobaculum zhutongyuii]
MPIYEYECGVCHHRLDKLQKLADAPLVECPECGESALVKLVSPGNFHLKGSGWYASEAPQSRKNTSSDTPCAGACQANCPGAALAE